MLAPGIQRADLCVRDVEDYYAFVFDPDRLRIEVFCAKPPQSGEGRWTMKER
jgi:hypothetical protein